MRPRIERQQHCSVPVLVPGEENEAKKALERRTGYYERGRVPRVTEVVLPKYSRTQLEFDTATRKVDSERDQAYAIAVFVKRSTNRPLPIDEYAEALSG